MPLCAALTCEGLKHKTKNFWLRLKFHFKILSEERLGTRALYNGQEHKSSGGTLKVLRNIKWEALKRWKFCCM